MLEMLTLQKKKNQILLRDSAGYICVMFLSDTLQTEKRLKMCTVLLLFVIL